jgi:putative membrane protein
MPQSLRSFIKRWLVTAVAVALAAQIVPGIVCPTPTGLILAALLLGLLNAFVRPVMLLLSLPLLIFTLGLFILVINAVLLYAVGHALRDFHVDSFAAAFWGSLIISIVSLALNSLTKGNGGATFEIRRGKAPPRRPPDDPGNGPVIDV